MKLVKKQAQMIVRNESLVEQIPVDSKYIIYSGLGHIVLDYSLLKDENMNLFNRIKEANPNNYFFRLSFMEDPKENINEVHCYLTQDLQYLKAKKITKSNYLCFLGISFTIISVEKLSKSKHFNDVNQYHCVIKNVYIDNETYDVKEEVLWDKTKYGNIESYLPKELSKYASFIESSRKRLFYDK